MMCWNGIQEFHWNGVESQVNLLVFIEKDTRNRGKNSVIRNIG